MKQNRIVTEDDSVALVIEPQNTSTDAHQIVILFDYNLSKYYSVVYDNKVYSTTMLNILKTCIGKMTWKLGDNKWTSVLTGELCTFSNEGIVYHISLDLVDKWLSIIDSYYAGAIYTVKALYKGDDVTKK